MVICLKCGEKKIIETETEKGGGGKCTVLKSDPPALRTGNDKFRISFSHVQRSLSNQKPAERERERKKNHSNCVQLGSQDVQLQVSYGCKSAAWAVLQQT